MSGSESHMCQSAVEQLQEPPTITVLCNMQEPVSALQVKKLSYSQAVCGETLAAGVMWPKCKQMTPPSVAEGRHVTGRANSGWKLLIQYMVQDQSSRLKSSTHDPTSQVEESSVLLWKYCAGSWRVTRLSYFSYCLTKVSRPNYD